MSKSVIEAAWESYPASHVPMDESLRAWMKDAFYAAASVMYINVMQGGEDGSEYKDFAAMMEAWRDEIVGYSAARVTGELGFDKRPKLNAYRPVQ